MTHDYYYYHYDRLIVIVIVMVYCLKLYDDGITVSYDLIWSHGPIWYTSLWKAHTSQLTETKNQHTVYKLGHSHRSKGKQQTHPQQTLIFLDTALLIHVMSILRLFRRASAGSDPCAANELSATSSSSSSTTSSGSSHDSHDSESSDSGQANRFARALAALNRRRRTEKARVAALVARKKRQLEPKPAVLEHPAARYKPDLQPRPEINKPGNFTTALHRRRLRVIFSWFKAWISKLVHFLQGPGISSSHFFTVNIVDDSNFVLSQLVDGAPNWRKARVVSVMNMVQTVVIPWTDDNECQRYQTYLVHTPMVCLPKTDAWRLGIELRSWLICFLGKIAPRFHGWGIGENSFAHIKIQGSLFCWDSLKTNIAILKQLRYMTHLHHLQSGHDTLHPVLANKCLLHQCALLRKPSLYHFAGFWSSIVRLSHLFEVSSFRQYFKSALIRTICQHFRVVHCSTLPPEAKEWRQSRNTLCGFVSNDPSYSTQRRSLHWQLLQYDNGDPNSLEWCHFCNGQCCTGTSNEEKEFFALCQVCRLNCLLFSFGFPVPLLYRWTHCHKALMYVNDVWLHLLDIALL